MTICHTFEYHVRECLTKWKKNNNKTIKINFSRYNICYAFTLTYPTSAGGLGWIDF